MPYDSEIEIRDANQALAKVVTQVYDTREVAVTELGLDGSLVDDTNPLPVTAVITSGEVSAVGTLSLDPTPAGGTYWYYSARIDTAGNGEVQACPSGGYIVVQGCLIRSKEDTDAAVTLFFDTDGDAGAYETSDRIVEDADLKASADSHPGSNSTGLHLRGLTDDDLRYEVTGGNVTVIAWGYTLVPA